MKTPHWSLLGGASGPSCSRGRPQMRGPGGAPHGRCQPVRGAWAGRVLGRVRQQGARRGGGAGGRGHRGALRGGCGGAGAGARGGGACLGSSPGPVRGRARTGGEEGEARSAVLYWGSLTVPRAKAAGTRGRGVPWDGAWHWDLRAPDTVTTPPIGSARALLSGASHPAPSPWVELESTQCALGVWCVRCPWSPGDCSPLCMPAVLCVRCPWPPGACSLSCVLRVLCVRCRCPIGACSPVCMPDVGCMRCPCPLGVSLVARLDINVKVEYPKPKRIVFLPSTILVQFCFLLVFENLHFFTFSTGERLRTL